MIRIAAAGDVHYSQFSRRRLEPFLDEMPSRADLFLLAGDLTQFGTEAEAKILAEDLSRLSLPKFAVLGNHDYHSDRQQKITEILNSADVHVLELDQAVIDVGGQRVAVIGLKGFGGGFLGACGSDFGEPEMKSFVRTTKRQADRLRDILIQVEADFRIVLMHYSPCAETLQGERKEIYPFLGSYLLAEAIDAGGADLVLHGHAHHGVEKGSTPAGIPVRNVAWPVIRHAYHIYNLRKDSMV